MVFITIVAGAYKPTYNWGASHCMIVKMMLKTNAMFMSRAIWWVAWVPSLRQFYPSEGHHAMNPSASDLQLLQELLTSYSPGRSYGLVPMPRKSINIMCKMEVEVWFVTHFRTNTHTLIKIIAHWSLFKANIVEKKSSRKKQINDPYYWWPAERHLRKKKDDRSPVNISFCSVCIQDGAPQLCLLVYHPPFSPVR